MIGKPKIIVFASGSKDGGGSGFENLVKASKEGILDAEITAVVSNYENGGVREKANRLGVNFIHFPKPWTEENYRRIAEDTRGQWFALSGWLKLAKGLDPRKTFNIHPGPLPKFGGKGMYGHHVHEAVMRAFWNKEVTCSAVTMHFVTEKYDEGPVFFAGKVKIKENDTSQTLAKRVNDLEHYWQPRVTNLVVNKKIFWDGKNLSSLVTPEDYKIEREI